MNGNWEFGFISNRKLKSINLTSIKTLLKKVCLKKKEP